MLYSTTMDTPIGELRIVASDAGVREIWMPLPRHGPPPRATDHPDHPILARVRQELDEYFRGERRHFDVPLDVQGTTFQRSIWEGLTQIPYGTTSSYGGLAASVGKPGAARAVGGANSRNPVPIVVPCHRVVGADGSMVGYAGPGAPGIAIKRWLLEHEATHAT